MSDEIKVAREEVEAWNKYMSNGGGTYVWDAAEYEFELNAPHRVLEIEAFHAGYGAAFDDACDQSCGCM